MKFPYSFIMFFSSCFGINSELKSKPTISGTAPVSIYSIPLTLLDGKAFDWSLAKGKKILIVNTASACGYTPQYEDLQKLHEKYSDRLVILGFPCNDFGSQEQGSAQEIQLFCQKNYGVTFSMMEKVTIKGTSIHPMYQWLTDPKKNGWNSESPSWNFGKYLISESGELIKFYGSGIKPFDSKLISAIESK
ncbi:MAG: glutathione peroxidase [Cytophagaceae bacterium]|nr:glutathione peroxidase [Cytophagaceae bacterium]